jgi:hypothetical protein
MGNYYWGLLSFLPLVAVASTPISTSIPTGEGGVVSQPNFNWPRVMYGGAAGILGLSGLPYMWEGLQEAWWEGCEAGGGSSDPQ